MSEPFSVLRVLLVDDENLARARLRSLLADCQLPSAQVDGEAASAVAAMHLLQHGSFDLVLLDIGMPGSSGLALAQAIAELPIPPAVVFVTAHAEHALQAFDLHAVDYLTKPVRLERLQAALQKVQRTTRSAPASPAVLTDNFLNIQYRGQTLRLAIIEVLYLKAELKYTTVRTANNSYILNTALSELEEKYAAHFLRVHRNALVAQHAIHSLLRHVDPVEGEGWALRVKGVGDLLMVSRRQLAAVRQALLAV